MGWFVEHLAAKHEREVRESLERLAIENIARRNLAMAYALGMIDWFQYLELCRTIGGPSVGEVITRIMATNQVKKVS